MTAPTYSALDLKACAEREAKMRRRVYPRWVSENRLTQMNATSEIAKMDAIAEHFAALAEKERLL